MTFQGETHVQILERENEELTQRLAAAEDRCAKFKSTYESNSESLLNEICKHTETMQRLAAAEAWNEFVHTQRKCKWTWDETSEHYDTGCGKAWCFQEDGIKENGLKFCPFCGGFVSETTEGV